MTPFGGLEHDRPLGRVGVARVRGGRPIGDPEVREREVGAAEDREHVRRRTRRSRRSTGPARRAPSPPVGSRLIIGVSSPSRGLGGTILRALGLTVRDS